MPWSIADTEYDNTHPWDSLYNGVPLSDVLNQTPGEQRLMAQAVATGSFSYPNPMSRETIQEYMTAGPPVDAGPARPQPTIESVLDGSALQPNRLYDRAPTDFSGTPAGMEASSGPSVPTGY